MTTEIRRAKVADAEGIRRLVNSYASDNRMLPRSLSEIFENIRDYQVAVDGGEVIGSCALHVFWEDLAELRSLAVAKDYLGRHLGSELVRRVVSEAPSLGVRKIFILTAIPRYFEKVGFRVVDKTELPQKIWVECVKCPKFPDCDEVALIAEV
jgi:amino-acid N-acetyltransferase